MPLASQIDIEPYLDSCIPKSDELPFKLARYALFSGGKRFRPKLVLSICNEKGLAAAASIECLHTYSLIHDDLPCMDDDDLRRGKPTLHKAFDEGQALLAGDYLQTLSFQLLAKSHYTPDQKIELIQILSEASTDMVIGQARDLSEPPQNFDELKAMHAGKTGALMRASLLFGACLIDRDREKLAKCGAALGLAFQLFDDVADGDFFLPENEMLRLANQYKQESLDLAANYPQLQDLIRML